MVVLLLLLTPVLGANNPGHDTLYVLKLGNSNVTGTINISENLTATIVQATSRFFGPNLDLRGDGSSTAATNQLIGTSSHLELSSTGDLILDKAVTGGWVHVGWSGTTTSLNVSGQILQQGQSVCLANGSNCPSTLSSSNVSGSGTTNTLTKWTGAGTIGNSILTETGSTLTINGNITMPSFFSIGSSNPIANVSGAIALGTSAQATGSAAIAIGSSTQAGPATTIAIGNSAIANGSTATAIGNGAQGTQVSTLAIGNSAKARGVSAAAYGPGAVADGSNSVAIGNTALASASDALAIGDAANASFTNSIALGPAATATASNQFVLGKLSTTYTLQVFGTLNTTDTIRQNNVAVCLTDGTNCAFAHTGSGWTNATNGNISMVNTAGNISANTLFIDNTNSKVGINTSAPTQALDVRGSINASGSIYVGAPTGGTLYFGNTNHYIQAFDASNTMVFSASSGTTHLALSNGDLRVYGTSPIIDTEQASVSSLTVKGQARGGNSGPGINVVVQGGTGSTSSTPREGGNVSIIGGNAGAGNKSGGNVFLYGGQGTGTLNNTNGSVILAHNGVTPVGVVGIGTNIPTTTLDVNGTINATAIKIGANNVCQSDGTNCPGGTGAGWLNNSGSGNISMANTAANISANTLFIDNTNSKVGVRTTTPTGLLEINGNSGATGVRITTNSNTTSLTSDTALLELLNTNASLNQSWGTNNYARIDFSATNSTGTVKQLASIVGIFSNHTNETTGYNGQLALLTMRAGTLTEALRIDQNGNLGVGTTTPSEKLGITGNLSTTTGAVFATTSGSVGIGAGAPAAKLHVNQTSGIGMTVESSDTTSTVLNIVSAGTTTQHVLLLRSNSGSTFGLDVDANGQVGIGTIAPTNTLDVVGVTNTTHYTIPGICDGSVTAAGGMCYNNTAANPHLCFYNSTSLSKVDAPTTHC